MNDERAQDALRHLQTAAVEMIEATRAALEVVEDVLRDPAVLSAVLATVQEAANRGAAAGRGGRRQSDPSAPPDGAAGASAEEGAPRPSRVTRIPVV